MKPNGKSQLTRCRRATLLSSTLVVALFALPIGSRATPIAPIADSSPSPSIPIDPDAPVWSWPEAGTVLYDNGPLLTCEGCGSGGADVSAVQNQTLGLKVLGYGNQLTDYLSWPIADDFTVPAGEVWDVGTVTLFAYQLYTGEVSTFTTVLLQIWDGDPRDPGSRLVFGDRATNRLESSHWTGMYRANEDELMDTDRPIMANVVRVDHTLTEGTYWFDWHTEGTGWGPPLVPPVTILGEATTGDALHWPEGHPPWEDLRDSGTLTQQGIPFILETSDLCTLTIELDRDYISPGDELALTVDLEHFRPKTVTVPFTILISNEVGEIVLERTTGPRTYRFGDTVTLERAIRVPKGITPGTYELIVFTDEMSQGEVRARRTFVVDAP